MADYKTLKIAEDPPTSTLLTLLPDLAAFRVNIFNLSTPMTLSRPEFEQYWPYVDNFYVLNRKNPPTRDGTITHYWWCRFHKSQDYIPTVGAQRKHNRTCMTAIGCPMKLKAVWKGDIVEISRVKEDCTHNHTLDDQD